MGMGIFQHGNHCDIPEQDGFEENITGSCPIVYQDPTSKRLYTCPSQLGPMCTSKYPTSSYGCFECHYKTDLKCFTSTFWNASTSSSHWQSQYLHTNREHTKSRRTQIPTEPSYPTSWPLLSISGIP